MTTNTHTGVPPPDAAGLVNKEKAAAGGPKDAHPSGKEGYGRLMQVLRGLAFAIYFNTCIMAYVPSPPP